VLRREGGGVGVGLAVHQEGDVVLAVEVDGARSRWRITREKPKSVKSGGALGVGRGELHELDAAEAGRGFGGRPRVGHGAHRDQLFQ
jgi:hypothetical protein